MILGVNLRHSVMKFEKTVVQLSFESFRGLFSYLKCQLSTNSGHFGSDETGSEIGSELTSLLFSYFSQASQLLVATIIAHVSFTVII